MGRIITLLTDFGNRDAYAGVMKGVILGINPQAAIVDITHEVEPQNILQAAYVLKTASQYFPENTVHVIVVDPGVGTDRKAVLLRTPKALFVAPDNGVLSYVYHEGKVLEMISLIHPEYWLQPVSRTFHGRDIFAPVAAHLSLGVPPHRLGETLKSINLLADCRPMVSADNTIYGKVIHIDRFGNLITNISVDDLPTAEIEVKIKGRSIGGLSATYAEGGELLALLGSDGHLEIGVRNGSAGSLLGATYEDVVEIKTETAI